MFARPALLSLRFGFAGSDLVGADGLDSPLILAHLAFCAKAIFRLEAAENFFRFPVGASGVAVALAGLPDRMARSSLIFESRCRFFSSKPSMAAVKTSVLSLGGM